jgi:hypothetical protein
LPFHSQYVYDFQLVISINSDYVSKHNNDKKELRPNVGTVASGGYVAPHLDGVRMSMEHGWNDWQEKTEALREKSVPVPFSPPQTPHSLP